MRDFCRVTAMGRCWYISINVPELLLNEATRVTFSITGLSPTKQRSLRGHDLFSIEGV
jgi:hypothetical protein